VNGVRQAIAIKIIVGIEEPLARPACCRGGAFHPFDDGTHQGGFPEPRPESFRAGFSFSTRPFLGSKVADRADSHPP
jgi:hypothetical protein